MSLAQGLTSAEAAARLLRFGPNEIKREARTPVWKRLRAQFASPLVCTKMALRLRKYVLNHHGIRNLTGMNVMRATLGYVRSIMED